jgi:hypothetical protein
MLIEWSEKDQAYLVTLPEWADRVMMPATHGNPMVKRFNMDRKFLKCWSKLQREMVNRFLYQRFTHKIFITLQSLLM